MDLRIVSRRRGVAFDAELEKIEDLKVSLSTLLADVLKTREEHGVSSAEVNPAVQTITGALTDLTAAGTKLVEARQTLLDVQLISVATR